MEKSGIKVCVNNHCEEVAHNCPQKETRCRNCNYIMVAIDKQTYMKKIISNPHQYDYSNDSGEIVTPNQMGYEVQLELSI